MQRMRTATCRFTRASVHIFDLSAAWHTSQSCLFHGKAPASPHQSGLRRHGRRSRRFSALSMVTVQAATERHLVVILKSSETEARCWRLGTFWYESQTDCHLNQDLLLRQWHCILLWRLFMPFLPKEICNKLMQHNVEAILLRPPFHFWEATHFVHPGAATQTLSVSDPRIVLLGLTIVILTVRWLNETWEGLVEEIQHWKTYFEEYQRIFKMYCKYRTGYGTCPWCVGTNILVIKFRYMSTSKTETPEYVTTRNTQVPSAQVVRVEQGIFQHHLCCGRLQGWGFSHMHKFWNMGTLYIYSLCKLYRKMGQNSSGFLDPSDIHLKHLQGRSPGGSRDLRRTEHCEGQWAVWVPSETSKRMFWQGQFTWWKCV